MNDPTIELRFSKGAGELLGLADDCYLSKRNDNMYRSCGFLKILDKERVRRLFSLNLVISLHDKKDVMQIWSGVKIGGIDVDEERILFACDIILFQQGDFGEIAYAQINMVYEVNSLRIDC